jgi:hypothetical protein
MFRLSMATVPQDCLARSPPLILRRDKTHRRAGLIAPRHMKETSAGKDATHRSSHHLHWPWNLLTLRLPALLEPSTSLPLWSLCTRSSPVGSWQYAGWRLQRERHLLSVIAFRCARHAWPEPCCPCCSSHHECQSAQAHVCARRERCTAPRTYCAFMRFAIA